MSIFYSPSTRSFYDETIHGPRWLEWSEEIEGAPKPSIHSQENPDCAIPADAVEVSADRHRALIEAQGGGKIIVPGKKGKPEAIDPEANVEEQLAAIRRKRDRALKATDWTQIPDALDAAKRKLWKEHRQALRDLPDLVAAALAAGTPADAVAFPEPPV